MEEYRALLAPLDVELRFPFEFDPQIDVVEDGDTYLENARKKAIAYVRLTDRLTIADDSGLEVDALGGAPGLHSARYVEGTDEERVEALLRNLEGVPWEERTARFRCVLVAALLDHDKYSAEGVCEGKIAFEPAGEGGFGYDPIFYLPERGVTMAQVTSHVKNQISHRARAVQAALPFLKRVLDNER